MCPLARACDGGGRHASTGRCHGAGARALEQVVQLQPLPEQGLNLGVRVSLWCHMMGAGCCSDLCRGGSSVPLQVNSTRGRI